MGLVDEAVAQHTKGHVCHVQRMMEGIEANDQAEPLTWGEWQEALESPANLTDIARALKKRYSRFGIITPNDQTIGRHRRGECQACK